MIAHQEQTDFPNGRASARLSVAQQTNDNADDPEVPRRPPLLVRSSEQRRAVRARNGVF